MNQQIFPCNTPQAVAGSSSSSSSASLSHQHDDALLPGCQALMEEALSCVRALVAVSQPAQQQQQQPPSTTPGGKKKGKQATPATSAGDAAAAVVAAPSDRVVRGCIRGLYSLFEALNLIMAPHSYLQVRGWTDITGVDMCTHNHSQRVTILDTSPVCWNYHRRIQCPHEGHLTCVRHTLHALFTYSRTHNEWADDIHTIVTHTEPSLSTGVAQVMTNL
jgi:hypothetical protein